ncbi:MAG: 5'-3' exonuclease H3TH domain-containing protein [Candidatus Krumholzibacteriia bacterium]
MPRRTSRRLMLIDGHSVAFRAFFALPSSLQDAAGRPANAVYGFMNILFRAIRDHVPTHLAVTFDLGRPFREDLYPDYKAHREVGPEDLEPQVRKIHKLLEAMNIPIFELEGFEADDLLATLVRQAGRRRIEVVVLTGDQDILQVVRPRVSVITPGRTFSEPAVYDLQRVRERYGVGPEHLSDYKGLAGDASDGIPGVRGIGKKTARELLQKYETLEKLYAHVDEIRNQRARNALAAGRDAAFLSRELARLRDDAPIELDLDASRLGNESRQQAVRAFRDMGFDRLADRVPEF